ncbi:hypothetical protein LCGC14_2045030, partial [marine sediment metagenome]
PGPTDDFWYGDYPIRDGSTDVTPDTAQKVAAVYACIQVRCETLAALPLHLMQRKGRFRWPATEHPLYRVLHNQPNDWQTSLEFREMMQGHLDLRGNAYAQIISGPQGAVDQLIPLHPDRMQVFRLETGRLGYLYRDQQGVEYRLTQDEVFHLRLRSIDGVLGLSPISLARRAVELAMSAEEHGIRYLKSGGQPSGVIKMGPGFHFEDEDHAKRLGKSWRDAHTGKELYTVAFLEDGCEWQQVGVNNTDSQWLESRTFQLGEIARMFRVPVFLIGGSLAGASSMYSNVEQSDMHLVKHTMLPIIGKWEQAIMRDLVTEPGTYYPKFNVDGLLRADSRSRSVFYKMMREIGAYSANDVLELEDRNPVPGGDVRHIPANWTALDGSGSAADLRSAKVSGSPSRGAEEVKRWIDEGFLLGETGGKQDAADVHRSWIADVAERIAKVEIEALESRADKAAADRQKFDAWVKQHWGEKQREYVARTLLPIAAASKSPIDFAALAARVCDTAVAQLTTGDPVEVLAQWKTGRAEEITKLLIGDQHDE